MFWKGFKLLRCASCLSCHAQWTLTVPHSSSKWLANLSLSCSRVRLICAVGPLKTLCLCCPGSPRRDGAGRCVHSGGLRALVSIERWCGAGARGCSAPALVRSSSCHNCDLRRQSSRVENDAPRRISLPEREVRKSRLPKKFNHLRLKGHLDPADSIINKFLNMLEINAPKVGCPWEQCPSFTQERQSDVKVTRTKRLPMQGCGGGAQSSS